MSAKTVDLKPALVGAVFAGMFIPAHDETVDLAKALAENLAAFHAYVTQVRDPAQADAALAEIGQAIATATKES